MTSTQLSPHPIIIPNQTSEAIFREKTIYYQHQRKYPLSISLKRTNKREAKKVKENTPKNKDGSPASNKLETIDKTLLSLNLEVLNQYNDIVGDEVSLTVRSLPPVKVSLQSNSKNKFMESPRNDGRTSSRIVRPKLSLKTYSSGHHIFTEGISKKSQLPNPSFALQKIPAPYSNLPDNVAIFKEKNKFAFGVKSNSNGQSPYKLAPKPFGAIESPTEGVCIKSQKRKKKKSVDESKEVQKEEQKNNTIKLEPIFKQNEDANLRKSRTTLGQAVINGPAKEPLAPMNSFYRADSPSKLARRSSHVEIGDQLSVVSIGETVPQTFYDKQKQSARKLYPMLEHKSKMNDIYKRNKYGIETPIYKEPNVSASSTFTYKVSTRHMPYERNERVSPIKNNLPNKSYMTKIDTESYNDFLLRRQNARKGFQIVPRSAGSNNSSTDMSQVPGNPPPSEISHHMSEDLTINITDYRNDLLTLHEERERTLTSMRSVTQPRPDDEKDSNIDDDDNNIESVTARASAVLLEPETHKATRTPRDNETDTDIQIEQVYENTNFAKIDEKEKDDVNDAIDQNEENIFNCDIKEELIGEEDISPMKSPNEDMVDGDANIERKELAPLKPRYKNVSNKQCMNVPTLSLDPLSQHQPLPGIRERTSLSRSLQNLIVLDSKPTSSVILSDDADILSDPDKTCIDKEYKSLVPITRLRLFSDASTVSINTPSVSLSVTDEHGEQQQVTITSEAKKLENSGVEKKLINNANILFISPLQSDPNAKRQ